MLNHLAAKPRLANLTLQTQKVLVVKWGLANSTQPIDTAPIQKYESIFAEPLLESKHKAFKVLFQYDVFLDDFVSEVNGLLSETA